MIICGSEKSILDIEVFENAFNCFLAECLAIHTPHHIQTELPIKMHLNIFTYIYTYMVKEWTLLKKQHYNIN